jgi:hypothetical protein
MCENEPAESPKPPAAHQLQERLMGQSAIQEVSVGVPAEHLPIYRLEAELLQLPQVDMPIDNQFCNGLYARTMHIPAGTVLTGAIHREESFFLVRKGQLIVSTDNGLKTLFPGDMSVSRVGTKRAGVALTDVDVTTFHANPTNEHEPKKLWDMFTIPAPVLVSVKSEHLEELT